MISLLDAAAARRVVAVVQTPEEQECLRAQGVVATSWPEGHLHALDGVPVAVISAPEAVEYQRTVTEMLSQVTDDVRIVGVPGGLLDWMQQREDQPAVAIAELRDRFRSSTRCTTPRRNDVLELERIDGGDPLTARDSGAPPRTLAEVWSADLVTFLDPDPFVLRPSSAGMGQELDTLLGGGLSVGQTVALVSHGAGVGKTAFVHQWADGIATASARSLKTHRVVTPVIMVSEMTTRDLTLRGLARQAGVPGFVLRDPRGRVGSCRRADGTTEGAHALEQAERAARAFAEVAAQITPIGRHTRIGLPDLGECVRRVRVAWTSRGVDVPAVVLIVDPLHRLLDPTRSEVEGLGEAMTGLLELAQREDAVVIFTSDTTKDAAAGRQSLSKLKRPDDLAAAVEMAFRGSYQLLHHPDFALGLATMRREDENLDPALVQALEEEGEGTLYAEIASAKSRWHERGLRAAYWLDPAKFSFRPTMARSLGASPSVEEQLLRHIERDPGCSQAALKKALSKRGDTVGKMVQRLLCEGRIIDRGSSGTGMRLFIAGNHSGNRGGTAPEQAWEQAVAQEAVPEGSPRRGESPLGEQRPRPGPRSESNGAPDDPISILETGSWA